MPPTEVSRINAAVLMNASPRQWPFSRPAVRSIQISEVLEGTPYRLLGFRWLYYTFSCADTQQACMISIDTEAQFRHDSSVLILDELVYDPFTENRQWPNGEVKIARPGPPATSSGDANGLERLLRSEPDDCEFRLLLCT